MYVLGVLTALAFANSSNSHNSPELSKIIESGRHASQHQQQWNNAAVVALPVMPNIHASLLRLTIELSNYQTMQMPIFRRPSIGGVSVWSSSRAWHLT